MRANIISSIMLLFFSFAAWGCASNDSATNEDNSNSTEFSKNRYAKKEDRIMFGKIWYINGFVMKKNAFYYEFDYSKWDPAFDELMVSLMELRQVDGENYQIKFYKYVLPALNTTDLYKLISNKNVINKYLDDLQNGKNGGWSCYVYNEKPYRTYVDGDELTIVVKDMEKEKYVCFQSKKFDESTEALIMKENEWIISPEMERDVFLSEEFIEGTQITSQMKEFSTKKYEAISNMLDKHYTLKELNELKAKSSRNI